MRDFGKELENRSFKGSDPASIEHDFTPYNITISHFTKAK